MVPPATLPFGFHGTGGELLLIYFKNFLLTLITLGVYYFWARVERRRYVYNQMELAGDRFAWHGTGLELLIGWLKAIAIFAVFTLAVVGARLLSEEEWAGVLAALIAYVGGAAFVPLAIVGAWRYRMSRSSYRGIRFTFRGRLSDAYKIYLKGFLLSALTLGFYTPWFLTHQRRYLVGNTFYGNEPFGFDGEGDELFVPYLVSVLLLLPTLGISALWFAERAGIFYWSHTRMATARFEPRMTPMGLLGITITNYLLIVFTLGIGLAWAEVRRIRYVTDHLFLHGSLDFGRIEQRAMAAAATGEGLSTVLDIEGAGFGL